MAEFENVVKGTAKRFQSGLQVQRARCGARCQGLEGDAENPSAFAERLLVARW